MFEQESSPEPLSGWKIFRAAAQRTFKNHCPECGEGDLRRSWFGLNEECGFCHTVFRRDQGTLTGTILITGAATEAVLAVLVALVFIITRSNVLASVVLALPLAGAFCLWFYPRAAGLWVAVQYASHMANRGRWLRRS